MNTIVSAAAVASATAVPAETLPTAAASESACRIFDCSPCASLLRAEQTVDLLRTRYIREGWKIDEEGAEQALAYCRKYAANGVAPDDDYQDAIEFRKAIDFFHDHGISIDWVFGGDIAGLICWVAKYSPRASEVADADLLSLAEEYIIAERAYGNLATKVDEIEYDFERKKSKRRPRGYGKAVSERDKAASAYRKIERQIANTPARTARGMFAKVRCAQHWTGGNVDKIDSGTSEETMAISIFEDVKRMSGDRVAAAEASWLPRFASVSTAATAGRRTDGKVNHNTNSIQCPSSTPNAVVPGTSNQRATTASIVRPAGNSQYDF